MSARALAGGALLLWLGGSGPAAANPAPAAPCPEDAICLSANQVKHAGIQVAPLVPSRHAPEVLAGGRIDFDDLRVARVSSPLSGRVAEVTARLGTHVAKGDPLLRLHAPQMGAILADAAALAADEVAARRNFERQKALYAERAVAAKEYEAAEDRLAQARASAEQARQKRRLLGAAANERSDTYVLRAPIEGNVIARDVATHGEVQGVADAGDQAPTLMTIGSLDTVWAIGEAFAIDAAALAQGQPVEVRVTAYPERAFPGRLDWLAASVEAATATVRVRVALDNPDHLLKPGMTATLRIAGGAREGLWLPPRAVFRQGADAWAFVASPEAGGGLVVRRRRVRIARLAADGALLAAEGLAAGDLLVVARGIDLLGG